MTINILYWNRRNIFYINLLDEICSKLRHVKIKQELRDSCIIYYFESIDLYICNINCFEYYFAYSIDREMPVFLNLEFSILDHSVEKQLSMTL